MNNWKASLKILGPVCVFVFVFLLGFTLSVQAYAMRQKELNSPVSQYLHGNYGVSSIEEYRAKLEQEFRLNYTQQMETLTNQYPEFNFGEWQNSDVYRQVGTSASQLPKTTSQPLFYTAVFSEPAVVLQTFSFSGLVLLGLVAVPPVRKNKRLKQAVVLSVIAVCVFSVGYFVGTISAQTGAITIEPNSFQTEASYIVFKDGDYIKARNGRTGEVEFSGTDASTVIQSALNALTPNRHWMEKIVLKGDFVIKVQQGQFYGLRLDAYTEIEIDGSLKFADSQNNYFIVTYAKPIKIHGGTIDGNGASQTTKCPIIYLGSGSGDVEIYDVAFVDSPEAIWTVATANLSIHDCSFTGSNYWFAITLAYDTSDVKITNNYFYNNQKGGVDVCKAEHVVISNNIFLNTPTNQDAGAIHLASANVGDVEDVTISGNVIEWTVNPSIPHGYGICVATYINTVTVVSNVINGHEMTGYETGIYLHGATSAGETFNVAIIGNVVKEMGGNGIIITYSKYVTALGNTILNCGQDTSKTNEQRSGIELASSSYCTVSGNVILDNQGTPTQTYGILETSVCDYNRISYNELYGNTIQPILKIGAHTKVAYNNGYVTENSGTATIPASQTSVTVNHGLAGIPTVITVTPRGNIGSVWVSARNSTSFIITCGTAPTSDTIVDWYAEYKP